MTKRFKGLDLVDRVKNCRLIFVTSYRRQWPKPSQRKRQNGYLSISPYLEQIKKKNFSFSNIYSDHLIFLCNCIKWQIPKQCGIIMVVVGNNLIPRIWFFNHRSNIWFYFYFLIVTYHIKLKSLLNATPDYCPLLHLPQFLHL